MVALPVFSELYTLSRVADAGVLHHGPEDHEETDKEVDVDGLHVGDLGQGRVDRVDQRCHCQDCGDPQSNLHISEIPTTLYFNFAITLAGAAPLFNQKETQDMTTMRLEGMYTCKCRILNQKHCKLLWED